MAHDLQSRSMDFIEDRVEWQVSEKKLAMSHLVYLENLSLTLCNVAMHACKRFQFHIHKVQGNVRK